MVHQYFTVLAVLVIMGQSSGSKNAMTAIIANDDGDTGDPLINVMPAEEGVERSMKRRSRKPSKLMMGDKGFLSKKGPSGKMGDMLKMMGKTGPQRKMMGKTGPSGKMDDMLKMMAKTGPKRKMAGKTGPTGKIGDLLKMLGKVGPQCKMMGKTALSQDA